MEGYIDCVIQQQTKAQQQLQYSFNMSNQQSQKSLLDPYRTIGGFVSGKLSLSQSSPTALTAPTGCSFKVYSENLAIKVASPSFPTPISSAVSYNEYTYLRLRDSVVKMKYHHIVDQWEVNGGEGASCLLKFQEVILLTDGNKLILINQKTGEAGYEEYDFEITGLVHPVTYVNKLILYGEEKFILVNAIANKILYSFEKFTANFKDNQQKIGVVEPTPLVDIVGVGFDNGVISFLNLKKDQVVFSVKQKLPVTALAFSSQQSWMVSGDGMGNILLWDLDNKRILYKFEEFLKGSIDSLLFMPGLPVITCASSTVNSICQLKINLDDNKVLSLYRERLGSKNPLQSVQIANNNELVLSTASQSMFVSFHSQCNNYLIPRTLDSKLPYHLIARHFNVEIYKGNSFEKSFPIHQYAVTAKISLSNKYYVVATKRRLIKLGGSLPVQWNIPNIRKIVLFNQHSIFAFTPNEVIVCDFNTDTVLARINVTASAPATNSSNTLIAFESKQDSQIQVWDMYKITQGRVFPIAKYGQTLCLSFTSDNRFLVSSHEGGKLNIWSVVDNQLYKSYNLEGGVDMICHSFTPDNQFMVSIFRGNRQANVWNNYIGRLTSSRKDEALAFIPEIRRLQKDYRLELLQDSKVQLQFQQSTEDVLDSIPDADDGLPSYSFGEIAKWMPLVYYDQIRARNAPTQSGEVPAMPFFLDFKNLTEEKKKIEEEIQKDIKEKRRNYSEQKDKHLKNKSNQITLDSDSTAEEQLDTFASLCKLSVAEVDYQLRAYLLNPANQVHLVTMITTVFADNTRPFLQELKNIILNRIINLLGADLLTEQLAQPCQDLLDVVEPPLKELKQLVDRCIAVVNKQTQ